MSVFKESKKLTYRSSAHIVMKFFLIVFLNIFFTYAEAFAQNYMVLRYKQNKKILIFPGEPFHYYLKNDPTLFRDVLMDVKGDSIILQYSKVSSGEIDAVDIQKGKKPVSNFSFYGGTLMIAGAGFFVIDQFNHVIVHGKEPRFDRGVNLTSLGLMTLGASGLFLNVMKKKKVVLGGRNKLLLLDLTGGRPEEKPIVEAFD